MFKSRASPEKVKHRKSESSPEETKKKILNSLNYIKYSRYYNIKQQDNALI